MNLDEALYFVSKEKVNSDNVKKFEKTLSRLLTPGSKEQIKAELKKLDLFYKGINDDHIEVLADFLDKAPRWAVERAIKWTLSSQNQFRHNVPKPGDIEAVVKSLLISIDDAVMRLICFEQYGHDDYKNEITSGSFDEKLKKKKELYQLKDDFLKEIQLNRG